jgi:Cof subfamily protein (haloacid dehalogenase superfamily)
MALNKVIATDLDGTLFYPRKRIRMISKDNRSFINKFMDDGGKILLVSGRNRYFGEKVAQNLHRQVDVVGCNGSFIVSDGQLVKESFFNKSSLKKILNETCREYKIPLVMLFTKSITWSFLIPEWAGSPDSAIRLMSSSKGLIESRWFGATKSITRNSKAAKSTRRCSSSGSPRKAKVKAREANKLLRLRYPDAEFSWVEQCIEITPKGASKSEGIAFYLDYNHLSRDNVLVIGDSGNDISMFEAFKEESFCMEHSPEAVQKHASHVIKRFYDLESYIYPSEENSKVSDTKKEGSNSK